MNAAETIAAAIEKLEDLRPNAEAMGRPRTSSSRPTTSALAQLGFDTIDAQLAILRYAGALASNFSATFGEHPNERQALDLARAILGEVA